MEKRLAAAQIGSPNSILTIPVSPSSSSSASMPDTSTSPIVGSGSCKYASISSILFRKCSSIQTVSVSLSRRAREVRVRPGAFIVLRVYRESPSRQVSSVVSSPRPLSERPFHRAPTRRMRSVSSWASRTNGRHDGSFQTVNSSSFSSIFQPPIS